MAFLKTFWFRFGHGKHFVNSIETPALSKSKFDPGKRPISTILTFSYCLKAAPEVYSRDWQSFDAPLSNQRG